MSTIRCAVQDDGLLGLVALVDDLEEEGGIGALEGQIAYLVYDKQLGPGENPQWKPRRWGSSAAFPRSARPT